MNIFIDKTRINRYSHEDAVNYALRYGLVPNPAYRYFTVHGDGGGDCSNFISQCLNAGGAPMDFSPGKAWWYKSKGTSNIFDDKWSVSWAVAHSLYWTLRIKGEKNLPGIKGIEVRDVSELQEGDIIQYENSRHIIYHSGIITAFTAAHVPLITQHTYNAINTTHIKPKASKMHFMKIVI